MDTLLFLAVLGFGCAFVGIFLVGLIGIFLRKPWAKKRMKTAGICLAATVVSFIAFGVLVSGSDNDENDNKPTKVIASEKKEEKVCEHEWEETKREEPTLISEGTSYQRCNLCLEAREEKIEKIEQTVTLDKLYEEFENNELRAKDLYGGQYFIVDGTMEGIEDSGLLNIGGGATLTVKHESKYGNMYLIATFNKINVEPLKQLNKGDYVKIYGKCISWGTWSDCQLIIEE